MKKINDLIDRLLYRIDHTSLRRILAIALLVVCLVSFASLYENYSTAQDALSQSRQAFALSQKQRNQRTRDRKAVDLKQCRAINSLRKINNRDRDTFQNAVTSSEQAAPEIANLIASLHSADGKLIGEFVQGLFAGGLASDKAELKARPLLPVINCVRQINPKPVKKATPKHK